MPSYTLPDLYTHSPVLWGGHCADVWFRGAPGVVEIDAPPTHTGEPIGAAYAVATDPYEHGDAERIVDALLNHLYRVALAALQGNPRASEIASRVIVGWDVVLTGEGDWPPLRVLYDRVSGMTREWMHETERLRRLASLDALGRAVAPLQVELAWDGPRKPYALVTWCEGRPPLPVILPFLQVPHVETFVREGAYRLAIAEVIAERHGRGLPMRGNPCTYALAMFTLSPEERRVLQWAADLSPASVAPPIEPRTVDRTSEIMRTIRKVWAWNNA
jgi:hypothetical protein